MSVEPRNGLWNRLLARAEARAKDESPPEPHHYHPLSAGDDHLRASFENSLIYHGLKIETEFSLRLQRPPRKRKARRKGDLPVAERLRNDRAAAGSPGPTHRTPTGTPTRRISKTTPLSRPPIPSTLPLPPIQANTRAAAARERVLNAVTDDDEPPVKVAGPVVELSDSSDDRVLLARALKPGGGTVIVLPHFDQAANSNDTSSWEDHAILVGQPPKGHDCDENGSKNPGNDSRSPSDISPIVKVIPRRKLSKRNSTRLLKTRKTASSDSSPAPDSDSGSRNQNDSVEDNKSGRIPEQRRKHSGNLDIDTEPTARDRKEIDLSKQDETGSNKKGSLNDGETAKKGDSSCTPFSDPLSTKKLVAVFRKLGAKGVDVRLSSPEPILSSSLPSDEERSTPSHRQSAPIRSVSARLRKPTDISVEDKLFGPLSPLSSPKRRTRSVSESEACFTLPDRDLTAVEVKKRTSPRQRNKQEAPASVSQARANCQDILTQETPVRRSPRRARRNNDSERRVCDLEVISSGPTNLKRVQRGHDNDFSTIQDHLGLKGKTVRKSAQQDISSDAWENALPTVPINVGAPPKLTRKIQSGKSAVTPTLKRSSDDSGKTSRKKRNSGMKRRVRPRTLRNRKLAITDDDSSDQVGEHEHVATQSTKSSLQKRKRRMGPSSKSPVRMHQQNKRTPVERKKSQRKADSGERLREQRKGGCSQAVQEIRDSDSDVCIVSFSPANGKGSTAESPRNGSKRHVAGLECGKKWLNCGQVEVIKSSSDDSNTSPTTRSRKEDAHEARASPVVKLPQRIRRPLDLRSNTMEERTRTGYELTTSDSDDDSDSSFGISWRGMYTKAQSAAKYGVLKSEYEEYMSKRRSLERDLENARKEERSGCDHKRSSSLVAALRDLRKKYVRPLNTKEGSKDSSRKKRKRK